MATLETAIAQHMEQPAELRARQRQWPTVCGVGPRVGLPRLGACERFPTVVGRAGTPLDAKAVVAYLGRDPKPYKP